MNSMDMRIFARGAGTTITFQPGSTVFSEGDRADNMYVVQSGTVEMVINGKVVDVCGPNQAFGFVSIIDGEPRTATARVSETAEVSIIDRQKFRFMVDEVPNFANYIMSAMADRIRGMKAVI